jgi:hypothetical protein
MGNQFATALADLDLGTTDKRLEVLADFCTAISNQAKERVRCWLARGYVTNLGQEWRVMARAAEEGAPEVALLRAHLDAHGATHLDLYGEELITCADDSQLAAELVRHVRSAEFRDLLSMMAARTTAAS